VAADMGRAGFRKVAGVTVVVFSKRKDFHKIFMDT
jgi:hypothetical protein